MQYRTGTYFTKTPGFIQSLFPQIIWRFPDKRNSIFLSFDDGPDPVSTTWILEILSKYKAKASFFCLGSQVAKYPGLFQRIKQEGHMVGNHGYQHISYWFSNKKEVTADVYKSAEIIDSVYFRPAYGQLTLHLLRNNNRNFKLVMWDVLPGDFNMNLSREECLKRAIKHSAGGSIVVLHDNQVTFGRVRYILPKYLEYFTKQGYSFQRLP